MMDMNMINKGHEPLNFDVGDQNLSMFDVRLYLDVQREDIKEEKEHGYKLYLDVQRERMDFKKENVRERLIL